MSSLDLPPSTWTPMCQPSVSVPSLPLTSSASLPVTSQELVLQLDDDFIVVSVGEYLRSVGATQTSH